MTPPNRFIARALAIREAALGPDHPDTATSLNNLAALHRARGEYDAAEPLFARALAIREAALGPDHPDTATSLNDLALLHRDRGEHDAAEPLCGAPWRSARPRSGPTIRIRRS